MRWTAGTNHGPFGKINFHKPNGQWCYGPQPAESRAAYSGCGGWPAGSMRGIDQVNRVLSDAGVMVRLIPARAVPARS